MIHLILCGVHFGQSKSRYNRQLTGEAGVDGLVVLASGARKRVEEQKNVVGALCHERVEFGSDLWIADKVETNVLEIELTIRTISLTPDASLALTG